MKHSRSFETHEGLLRGRERLPQKPALAYADGTGNQAGRPRPKRSRKSPQLVLPPEQRDGQVANL
jgi:hypothetical protein